jgi:WD40 repeat protein
MTPNLMDTTAGNLADAGLPVLTVTALGRAGSRAVVVGTGTHLPGSALPGIPAVAATVTAVRDALTERCGMDGRHVVSVADPESPTQFLDAVNQAAAQAEDVLLLYYIGHGLVRLDGEFFLATAATTDREVMLPVEALPFAAVRGVLSASRARHVVVVLDCCFSGRASGVIGTAVADAFELANVHGSYLLSATSATGQALAPEGERYTAFSGALLGFLREGTPAAPRELTLDDAYRHLERALPARGAPAPQRRAGGDAGGLVVAVNPQAPPVTRPRPGHSERILATPSSPYSCPYPGLEAFTAADTRYFHGRERLVDEILRVLAADGHGGPLAVVGRSGAGKSSLLQAGLLPAIRAGRLEAAVPGSRQWPQVVMTPGEHPVHTLGRRLAAGPAPQGLILCVDQFEEVFTACSDEAERGAFIQALCTAPARGSTPRVQVILGLRADFYDRCLDYPELAPMVEAGQVPVRPMSREELKSVIEAPADAAGLRLEEDLTRRLLLDLEPAGGPGRDAAIALPLLAFALQATWQASDRQTLTLSDYEATGSIWGAVTQRAEEVYGSLGPAQDATKLLLVSMVQLGDGTDDVRRRVSLGDLLAGRPDAARTSIRRALEAYVAARLVTVDNDTAEIAHEALLRAWPRLRQWIEEDRKDLLDRQRLSESARLWQSGNGPLWTGARLEEARKWLGEEPGQARRSLSVLERDFVRASVRATRRRRRRRWSAAGTAMAAVMLLITGSVYAVQQRAGNQDSQAVQSSVALAQNADNLRATDPAGAMWLSLAAYRSSQTSQARTELYDSLTTPYPLTLPGGGTGKVDSVAYSPDGKTAAAVWDNGIMRVWRVSNPLRPVLAATIKTRPGGIDRLAFSPDGGILALHELHSLELWDTGDGTRKPVLLSDTPVTSSRADSTWLPVAFSPDGRLVAAGDGDGRFRIWNVADPAHPGRIASVAASSRPLTSVAFSPDGDALAVANENSPRTGQDGGVGLWDVRDPARLALRSALRVNSALSVAFSPVGHLLVASGSDDDVHAWNVADVGRPVSVRVNSDNNNGKSLISVAFRPGSELFLTADSGGRTDVWTDSQGDGIGDWGTGVLPDSSGPKSVAFSPSGEQVLTGDYGGSVQLWTALTPLLPGTVGTEAGGSPFNADGSVMAVQGMAAGVGSSVPIELWDVSDPLHPVRDAVLPGNWISGAFLPGGSTLVTFTDYNDAIRLWNVADPRHPKAGAELSDDGTSGYTSESWNASDNGLLLLEDRHDVQLWNVRNTGHPVLDATLKVSPVGPVAFLSDQLVAVNIQPSPVKSEMELWDVTDPRHPVRGGVVPNGDPNSGGIYIPSRHELTASTADANVPESTLWSLRDLRRPNPLARPFKMDSNSVIGLNDDTWAALTPGDDAIEVWNASNPRKPTATTALSVGNGNDGGLSAATSPGGWLVASGFTPPGGNGIADLAQVRGDGKAISDYVQLPADPVNYAFSPNGKSLATNIGSLNTNGFEALVPQDIDSDGSAGIVYPMNSGALYQHLCKIATQTRHDPSWNKYLPATYYRPACS